MPHIDIHEQPRYAANRECVLWRSYEGANNWRICELLLAMVDDEKGAQDLVQCILNAMEACMLLMIWEGEVGGVGMTDNAAMGYYVIKWTSEPYNFQAVKCQQSSANRAMSRHQHNFLPGCSRAFLCWEMPTFHRYAKVINYLQ